MERGGMWGGTGVKTEKLKEWEVICGTSRGINLMVQGGISRG